MDSILDRFLLFRRSFQMVSVKIQYFQLKKPVCVVYACTFMWGQEVAIGFLPHWLSTLCFEAGSLTEAGAFTDWLDGE